MSPLTAMKVSNGSINTYLCPFGLQPLVPTVPTNSTNVCLCFYFMVQGRSSANAKGERIQRRKFKFEMLCATCEKSPPDVLRLPGGMLSID